MMKTTHAFAQLAIRGMNICINLSPKLVAACPCMVVAKYKVYCIFIQSEGIVQLDSCLDCRVVDIPFQGTFLLINIVRPRTLPSKDAAQKVWLTRSGASARV